MQYRALLNRTQPDFDCRFIIVHYKMKVYKNQAKSSPKSTVLETVQRGFYFLIPVDLGEKSRLDKTL